MAVLYFRHWTRTRCEDAKGCDDLLVRIHSQYIYIYMYPIVEFFVERVCVCVCVCPIPVF